MADGDQSALALLQGLVERGHERVVLAAGHKLVYGQPLHLQDAVAEQGLGGVIRGLDDAFIVDLQAGRLGIGVAARFGANPLDQIFPHSARD